MTLAAITIRLPYAAAIRSGVKLVENRGRQVAAKHLGQQVAIHAAAAWSKDGAADPRIRDWRWSRHPRRGEPLDAVEFAPMFRKVLSVATLSDCHLAATPINADDPNLTCCRPWGDRIYSGRLAWHLVLDDVVALPEPVTAHGSLAVPWTLPDDVERAVRAQLTEVSA